MKVVGVFRELGAELDQSLGSIRAVAASMSEESAGFVVRYLKQGIPIFDVMEATVDPFDGKTRIDGGPSLVSDGEWVWRNDLAYFVEKYRIALPKEFVECARAGKMRNSDESRAIAEQWEAALTAYEKLEKL